jgi:hypothetical protein
LPAIHQLFRLCPSGDGVIVFGDGSIYSYPASIGELRGVREAIVKGRAFNRPAVRRVRQRPSPGYSRLDTVPAEALAIYSEPPYDVAGPEPGCPPPGPPLVICADATLAAFALVTFGVVLNPLVRVPPDLFRWTSVGSVTWTIENVDVGLYFFDAVVAPAFTARWIHVGDTPFGVYNLATGSAPDPITVLACV